MTEQTRQGFLLQPTSRLQRGRAVVHLHGVLETGEGFLIEDDRFEPYFFVPDAHLATLPKLEGREGIERVEKTALRDLEGRPVSKVVAHVPGAVPELRRRIEEAGGDPLEADVRFAYRYLIDHGLRASIRIEGEAERLGPRLLRFANPTLSAGSWRPSLRVLSIDLETTPDAGRILSAALVAPDVEEVHLVSAAPVEGAVVHADERELLCGVRDRIRALDPDVITGWNVVDFDLRVWVRRCESLGLRSDLGRVDGGTTLQRDLGFTRQGRAFVPGRQVLDGQGLVRDALSIHLDDYRLETAAQALLGRGKRVQHDGPRRAEEIQRLYREDPVELCAYNLEDARLVLEILERESLLELAVERSLLSGMQLDRVGASIASFDLVYLPELRARGYVAPSVRSDRKSEPVRGGAVLASHPGLFRNVAVFDYRSLYPSLIRTFSLDPLAHARAGERAIEAPNGARFEPGEAILPEVIARFMERREEAKRRGDPHADLAIKIMMNALFGVLGAGSCRFFDPAVANAITSFGQQTLAWAREAFEAEGARVLYGDTDSVFVALDPDAAPGDVREAAESIRGRVQESISTRIRDRYGVEPQLELELERIYARFFQPTVRGGVRGSAKKYAGLVDDRVVIVGLEAVRRDTPVLARRLQEGMLARLFADRPVAPFVKELVDELATGALDRELVIRKGLRKGRYTATTPHHVQAARKAGDRVDRVVRYVITRTGPEPVLDDEPFPKDVDREYYLEKVLRPIADAILPFEETSFDEVLGRPRQLSLL